MSNVFQLDRPSSTAIGLPHGVEINVQIVIVLLIAKALM